MIRFCIKILEWVHFPCDLTSSYHTCICVGSLLYTADTLWQAVYKDDAWLSKWVWQVTPDEPARGRSALQQDCARESLNISCTEPCCPIYMYCYRCKQWFRWHPLWFMWHLWQYLGTWCRNWIQYEHLTIGFHMTLCITPHLESDVTSRYSHALKGIKF